MQRSIISKLKMDALEIQQGLNMPYYEDAFKLAIEIWRVECLSDIAHFLRQDGEFQESMSQIAKAINEKL